MIALPTSLDRLLETPFLTGGDWERFCSLCRERTEVLEGGETILCAEADTVATLANFFSGMLKRCALFLANPKWSSEEWTQVESVALYHKVFGCCPINPHPSAARYVSESRVMVPSGGTSGKIRFCAHSPGTLSAAVERLFLFHGGKPLNSINTLPACHISGLMPVLRACLTGGVVRPTDWKSLESGRFPRLPGHPCSLSLVPTQLARLVKDDAGLRFLHALDVVYVGGAATPPALVNFIRTEKLPVLFVYGSTETAAMVIAGSRADTDSDGRIWGEALPGVSVELSSDGEMVIRTPSLFRGYYPDDTEKREYFTGDLGLRVTAQSFLVLGRKDFLINTGGEKVNPEEVESVLAELSPGWSLAVSGRPDDEWGERVVAVTEEELSEARKSMLRCKLAERLAAYKIPKEFITVDSLPRTAMGKVNRAELRRQLAD